MDARKLLVGAALGLALAIAGASQAGAALPVTPDLTWGTNGKVDAVLRVGSTIYLGGTFTELDDTQSTATAPASDLAGIDATTGQPTGFAPTLDGEVFALAASADGSRLYVGGNFNTVNGKTQKKIAVFNTATGALVTWKPAAGWPNNVIRAIAVGPSSIYVGGAFTKIGQTALSRMAELSTADGSLVPGFSVTADNLVRALVLTSSRLYMAGNFTSVNGTDQKSLTAVSPATGASIAGVYHPTYPVLALAPGSTRLYGGGGGGGGKALAVSLSTGAKSWEQTTDGNIQAVAVLNDTPYFGGHFFKYSKIAVSQLVRANPSTGALDTTWLPAVTAGFLGVFTLDGEGANKLYIGGDFTRVQNLKRLNFAQFTDSAAPAAADLSIALSGSPGSVNVGQQVTFTATVANAGPDTALATTVIDTLPAGLDFASAPGCTYDGPSRTVTCALGAIGTGGASVTITSTATAAGAIANTASVSSSTTDPDPSDNSSSATTTVTSAGGADLGVSTSAPARVDQGTGFAYTLTVTNAGPSSEPDATLTDTLPANASPAGGVTTTAGSCSGSATVTCDLGPMAAGDTETVTIPMTAPGSPQTLVNSASVSGTQFDAVSGNDSAVTYTGVRDPGSAGDTTPPSMTGMTMLDTDEDGFVDHVAVTFTEPLATCAAPCTDGWTLANVPSGGSLQSVTTSGDTATLAIGGWTDDADTSVSLFRVGLGAGNEIQDMGGNRASFAAAAPADRAGPVPVGFRHQHNTSNGTCVGTVNTAGVPEDCDEVTAEWSEPLAPSSIPATTTLTLTDPAGPGNDTLTVGSFIAGAMDLGSDGFVTADGTSAGWASSQLVYSSAGQSLTVRILGACTGAGCGALGTVKNVTVTYTPSPTITDPSGNPAGGTFSKTQTMF
ncbi:MAG TPA: DUF11 domain-containing protein [Gaiellales bacterium]|jgi:uncharacterized repeat protein (TIGR01451 family)|nr:DUF11 domain-containing protein [Gaiellales bacterium]